MKKVIMALPIVLILIVMILSLTCPISYSYHVTSAKIDSNHKTHSKSGEDWYYFREDLGISSGGAIAIVVIFCVLAISGIIFLYKAKNLGAHTFYALIFATSLCAMVPFFMTIACSAMNTGDGSEEFISAGGATYYASNHNGLKGGGVAIIILTIVTIVTLFIYLAKTQNEKTSLSQKQIEKAKAEVTEDNWLS